MSTDIIKGEYKVVPLSQVMHDENNARQSLENIEELAADIKANRLINPLTVTNGGDKYVVRAGNRRLAALKLLKVKDVPVIVIPNEDVEVTQLVENLGREELHLLDTAQRLFDLADPKGSYGKKYTIKELAERLQKSVAHVENLIRVRKKLSDEVWSLARASKYALTTRVVFAWAAMPEEEQLKAFKAWEKMQEKIAAHGRKRGGGEGEGEGEGGGKKKERGALSKKQAEFIGGYRDVIAWKLENARGVAEKAKYEGALDVLNFVLGESKRTSIVSSADFKAWADAQAAEEAAEEEEG